MRDLRKNEEYFSKYINYQNQRIAKFETLLEKTINEKGMEFKGVRTGQLALLNFYLDKINALYSAGKPIEEIKRLYPSILEYFMQIWNKDGSYSNLLKVLSLSVLLNIPTRDMQELISLVKSEKVDDNVINLMLHYMDNTLDVIVGTFPSFEPYNFLGIVVNNDGSKQALSLLKEYLENKWYRCHSDTGWHNSHQGDKEIYNGYWSFEAGAIAKILKLNDEELKDLSYYPYDMVHFED